MRRLQITAGLILLALTAGGCACFDGFSPCNGPRCENGGGPFGSGVPLGGGCGSGSCGGCSDCSVEPSCSCATPVDDCSSCPSSSCATPDFTLRMPRLWHALFGCTGCDGDLYWSEWFSDPPDCCDPCDEHGNWTGHHPQSVAYASPLPGMDVVQGPVGGSTGCPCGGH